MHNSDSQLKGAFMNLEKVSQENIRRFMFHKSNKIYSFNNFYSPGPRPLLNGS